MEISDLRGVICPMLTAFDDGGRLDERGIRDLVDFLLGHGVDALYPGGTNGEGMLLSLNERKQLAEIVVSQAGRRAPVIIHSGCISTADSIELTRHARDVGADAAALIVPYYFTFDDGSLAQHFEAVARAVPDFPLFIYCFPGAAKNDVSPRLLADLHERAPNIVGAKITNPDISRVQEYFKCCGERMVLFSGIDALTLPALAVGSRGQVSGNANVFPEVLRDLYRAFVAGDMATAQRKQRLLNDIRHALSDGVHPAYLKAALCLRGVNLGGAVRPPMRMLRSDEQAALQRNVEVLIEQAL